MGCGCKKNKKVVSKVVNKPVSRPVSKPQTAQPVSKNVDSEKKKLMDKLFKLKL